LEAPGKSRPGRPSKVSGPTRITLAGVDPDGPVQAFFERFAAEQAERRRRKSVPGNQRKGRCVFPQTLPPGPEPVLLYDGHLRRGQPSLVAFGLSGLDRRQHSAEPLVLDDFAGANLGLVVDGGVRKGDAAAADFHTAIVPLVDADLAAAELEGLLGRLDEVRDTIVHDQVARHRPLLLPGEDIVESLLVDGPVRIWSTAFRGEAQPLQGLGAGRWTI